MQSPTPMLISEMANIQQPQHRFAASWSGGKDACMALYLLMQAGHHPEFLLTMMNQDGQSSRAHNLPKWLIEAQADAIGVPNFFKSSAKAYYKDNYLQALEAMKVHEIDSISFGDIDLQIHRDWQEEQTAVVDVTPLFPLWLLDHRALVDHLIAVGFKSIIMAVNPQKAPETLLGKSLNAETIAELEIQGIDVCAEGGEFHTVMIDGPIFKQPVQLPEPILRTGAEYGYSYLDFSR